EHSNHDHAHHGSHGDHGHGGGHGGHDHHDHGDMVEDFKKRFYISLIVTIPILVLSPMIQGFIGVDWRYPYDQYILFVLTTYISCYGGCSFITDAISEIKDKYTGMMLLIGLAILVAYVYSALIVFGLEGSDVFWELATLIYIMLLGHWIEMRSVMGSSNAL